MPFILRQEKTPLSVLCMHRLISRRAPLYRSEIGQYGQGTGSIGRCACMPTHEPIRRAPSSSCAVHKICCTIASNAHEDLGQGEGPSSPVRGEQNSIVAFLRSKEGALGLLSMALLIFQGTALSLTLRFSRCPNHRCIAPSLSLSASSWTISNR